MATVTFRLEALEGGGIHQATSSHVDEKIVVGQEICTKNVEVHVSHNEGPRQMFRADLIGHRTFSVSFDRRPICCRKRRAFTAMLAVEIRGHLDGHLGAYVDEVVFPAIVVINPNSIFVGLGHYLPPASLFPERRPFLNEAAFHLHRILHFLASAPKVLWK